MKNWNLIIFAAVFAIFSIAAFSSCDPGTGGDPDVITIADIPGVTAPVAGATPVTTITATGQYTGTVEWNNGNPTTFAASTVYTATITLTPKAGFTLQGVGANFFTVTGASPVTNPANSGVITAVFPATAVEDTTINIAAIPGVTAPATDATPVTAITETAQYSGTVEWNGNPTTFASETIYTATITLTAKTGYTLQGVAANFFSVAGTSTPATNAANSGVITAVFPATAAPAPVFNSIASLTEYLADQPANNASTPYPVALNVNDLTGIAAAINSSGRYISLDLSGSTLTSIPDTAFVVDLLEQIGCTYLTSVIIPDSVTSIEMGAFSGCTSLASVIIPDSVTSIGGGAFFGCTSLASISIPDSVTSIEVGAFSGCTSLASISIPDSVTSIGRSAFESCRSLASVSIPDSVTSIEVDAFLGCTSLASVSIPDSVTSIGGGAFESCRSLASVTLGNNVTSIEVFAFSGCTSLASIDIPDSVTSIRNYTFYNCTSLASVSIPDGVTSIGDYAFYNCTSLASVSIPDGVTSIGESAFEICTSLASVSIPDSVTSIGEFAFSDCTSLTSINVNENNTAYSSDNGVLFNKAKTTLLHYPTGKTGSYTIPNSVTSIGNAAFQNCTSLASVTIPDSVTSIGDLAFYPCTSLASVNFQGTISEGNFSGIDSFLGDLRAKYLGGGPGTYTTINPGYSAVWTKQP